MFEHEGASQLKETNAPQQTSHRSKPCLSRLLSKSHIRFRKENYMVLSTLRSALVFLVLIAILSTVAAQKPKPKPRATPLPEVPAEDEQKTNEPRDVDVVKTDTNLVTVPVIATDRGGLYIPDLVKEDLAITEDGVPQEIAFFAQTSAPFHVILMLDTSASTREHLQLIQKAAYAFVQQLQSEDRVKIISF